jgi:predicted DNA-binding transcriptional regulator YafY
MSTYVSATLRIGHSLWFLRPIRHYGPDCLVHSPAALRDLRVMGTIAPAGRRRDRWP